MSAAPFFWQTPLKYCRWAARERPALFWSVIIGAAGPVAMPIVPPIRHYFGDIDAPPVPVTYPSACPAVWEFRGMNQLTRCSSRWSQETAHRLRRLRSRIEDEEINITVRRESTGKRENSLVQTTASTDSATAEGEKYHRGIQGTRVQFSAAIDASIRFSTSNQPSRPPTTKRFRDIYTLCAHLRESMIF